MSFLFLFFFFLHVHRVQVIQHLALRCVVCPSQTLVMVALQRPQSFHVHDLVCPFCVLIKRLSDTAFQMVDAEPGGGRDGDHVSEHEVVFG